MKELICITCPRGCHLMVDENNNVTGNFCPRGAKYAINELTHPMRTLTTTVKTDSKLFVRLPVKSKDPLPKECIFKAMEIINNKLVHLPIKCGDIVISNICNSGVDIVATKTISK